MTISVAILGGPGSGAIVAQSVQALVASGRDIRLVGFLNDVLPEGDLVSGVPVLGPFASWRMLAEDILFLAPLHKVKVMAARAEIIDRLGIPEYRWATIVDPMTAIASDARMGRGCFVGPFASIGPDARLGTHTVVRAGSCVSHDCAIGNFVFVGSNSVVCGSSTVEDGAYIAPGATIGDKVRVGKFAVVGLGSVVTRNVADFDTVIGSPAKTIVDMRSSLIE